jgi:hypothetical protein
MQCVGWCVWIDWLFLWLMGCKVIHVSSLVFVYCCVVQLIEYIDLKMHGMHNFKINYQTEFVCRQSLNDDKITDSHINCETPTTSTLLRTLTLMLCWGRGSSVSDWIWAVQQQLDLRKAFYFRHQVQAGSVVLPLVPGTLPSGKSLQLVLTLRILGTLPSLPIHLHGIALNQRDKYIFTNIQYYACRGQTRSKSFEHARVSRPSMFYLSECFKSHRVLYLCVFHIPICFITLHISHPFVFSLSKCFTSLHVSRPTMLYLSACFTSPRFMSLHVLFLGVAHIYMFHVYSYVCVSACFKSLRVLSL